MQANLKTVDVINEIHKNIDNELEICILHK